MTFKDKVNVIVSKAKAKITPESAEEVVNEFNEFCASLDDLQKDYDSIAVENSKFKDALLNMVLKQGDDKPPKDDDGDKPKSIEECLVEIQNNK